MLKKFKLIDGKLVENDSSECPVLVYIAPDEGEKKYLIEELKIDQYNITSALDPNEIGRMEFDEGHTMLIIKQPKRYCSDDNFLLKISSMGLFIFPDKLIILLAEDAPIFDGRQFIKVRSIQNILLKVIHRCISHFEEHLRVIQAISDELEEKINTSMENKHLHNMFNLEKSLVYYLKSISSNSKVIEKIKANVAKFNFNPEDIEYLDDVAIENSQCYEQANTHSQVLSSMMDAWVSVVSNNLNILIKKLTLVMICIMLPTLIISVFSMNVKLPLEQELSGASFWLIVGLAAFSAIGVFLIWRHKKL
ncbi:MAG TPA: magnesium transporter CorA family protein [Candidatus Omnitrophota bacterium]|nr:magnesium transporter CorA family protein [Candidatus Omnitrophota bacterium]HPD85518.1 magnesium transporter CorA family protein [Candidatus Omnitrophota bacterium]HRZ04442.1 magnesium transporter CorA family protein [Candidatus Omnitrophota bacterium]